MEIDLSPFNSNINTDLLLLILKIGGGILLLFILIAIFLMFFYWFWLPSRQKKYLATVEYVVLAIDVPKEDEQSPKAVEHIFSTFAGMLSGPNLYEKYWLGEIQLSLSLELISQEGYIQYLIRTPSDFRDLVEAAFYAQYPDAEISEVEDYVQTAPDRFPSDSYQLWGSDLKLAEHSAYPIRTYPDFEHSLSQELKDPLSTLLEEMTRIGKGEYIWLQWVITPTNDKWKKSSEGVVKKLIGEKVDGPKDIAYYMIQPFISLMKWLGDVVVIQAADQVMQTAVKQEPNKLLYLTAGQKDIVQGIEQKMKKTGFLTKGRIIYFARRETFMKSRGVSPIIGAINQFNTLNMNAFTKDKRTTTSADYVRVEKRLSKKQNRVLKAYKKRIGDKTFGSIPYILNIEELATLYHFPDINIKAPSVKTTESRRGQAPVYLPTERESGLTEIVEVGDEVGENIPFAKIDSETEKLEPQEVIKTDEEQIKSIKDDIINSMSKEEANNKSKKPPTSQPPVQPKIIVQDEQNTSKGGPPSNLPM